MCVDRLSLSISVLPGSLSFSRYVLGDAFIFFHLRRADFEHVDDKHFNEGMWKGWLSFVETIPPEEFAPFVRPLISRVLRDVSRNPSVIVQDLAEDGTPLPSSLDEQQEDSNAFFVSRGPRSAGRSTTDEREKSWPPLTCSLCFFSSP